MTTGTTPPSLVVGTGLIVAECREHPFDSQCLTVPLLHTKRGQYGTSGHTSGWLGIDGPDTHRGAGAVRMGYGNTPAPLFYSPITTSGSGSDGGASAHGGTTLITCTLGPPLTPPWSPRPMSS